MNIFATSPDQLECARDLDDLRLTKMVLETVQILCTVAHSRPEIVRASEWVYRPTHPRHPCVLWAAEDASHAWWLHGLGVAYGLEFERRRGHRHGSIQVLQSLRVEPADRRPTTWAGCAESDHPDVHEAYRETLVLKWARDMAAGRHPRWTTRDWPEWRVRRL